MKTIELARKLAEHKQVEDAQNAYSIALEQEELAPEEEMEAAIYLLVSEGNYQIAYTTFVSLFNRGLFQAELLDLMSQAFYFPNVQTLRQRYEENCRLLQRYPYCFREDFPPFDELPIWFFPYSDHKYVPYFPEESHFGELIDICEPVIDRYFFQDLENPILAKDVYSQYQLEYLNDTVRKSEWVGRENHIYLHYTSWPIFCAYLQCIDFRKILKEKKFVFLIEEESALYPIDFQARFGIDYSKFQMRPIGVKEVNRLIWHTQLATHNGGDFFNEIFYDHPNLIALDSLFLKDVEKMANYLKVSWKKDRTIFQHDKVYRFLKGIKNPTDKDFFVAMFVSNIKNEFPLSGNSRIAPALFFQPHFPNMVFEIHLSEKGNSCILTSKQYDALRNSPIFNQFKYIKTFTPMRRITTSYSASTRFAYLTAMEEDNSVVNDMLMTRVLNRSFMIDPDERIYRDSVLVRFEDGKLNPKATFTALAEFLDIPYTESMTYCSSPTGEINGPSVAGNVAGFDPVSVYRTYDDYADDADRAFLEYFMRDAYDYYGYDFHYYKGEEVDSAWIEEKAIGAVHLDHCIEESYRKSLGNQIREEIISQGVDPDLPENQEKMEELISVRIQLILQGFQKNRITVAETLQKSLHFVNLRNQPLRFMKKLELDPALLEQPIYH